MTHLHSPRFTNKRRITTFETAFDTLGNNYIFITERFNQNSEHFQLFATQIAVFLALWAKNGSLRVVKTNYMHFGQKNGLVIIIGAGGKRIINPGDV